MLCDAFPDAPTAILAESPIWDGETGRFIWIDMNGTLFTADRTGTVAQQVIGRYLAAVAMTRDDDLCLVLQRSIRRRREGDADRDERPLIDSDLRFNDAGCDPTGRLLIGTTRLDRASGGGALVRLDEDGSATALATGLTLPNGMGWNGAGDAFYLADSEDRTILRGHYDARTGELGSLLPVIGFEPGAGKPDGLCLCEDDSLWVAMWGGGCVRRYSAEGLLVDRIDLPVTQPSSCAVDAEGTLYITTAAYGLGSDVHAREPLAGRVLRVDRAGPPGLQKGRAAL